MKKKRTDFTHEEHEFLLKNRLKLTATEMATALNRQPEQIGAYFRWRNISYLKVRQIQKFGLTQREEEIAKLITLGKTDKEICETLFIQNTTLRTHINHIYTKISVSGITQAGTMRLKVALYYIKYFATYEFIQELRED